MSQHPESPSLSALLGVDISEIRSDKYHEWIINTATKLKEQLPFEGPADITVVLGSGLNDV